jgi:hypothetical protein
MFMLLVHLSVLNASSGAA